MNLEEDIEGEVNRANNEPDVDRQNRDVLIHWLQVQALDQYNPQIDGYLGEDQEQEQTVIGTGLYSELMKASRNTRNFHSVNWQQKLEPVQKAFLALRALLNGECQGLNETVDMHHLPPENLQLDTPQRRFQAMLAKSLYQTYLILLHNTIRGLMDQFQGKCMTMWQTLSVIGIDPRQNARVRARVYARRAKLRYDQVNEYLDWAAGLDWVPDLPHLVHVRADGEIMLYRGDESYVELGNVFSQPPNELNFWIYE